MKPGPPHVSHPKSRRSLELAVASYERLAVTWREIAASAEQSGNEERRERAEAKISECETELARLSALLLDLDRG